MILWQNKVQSGRSMIEMLGVLAIVGILSAGGIAGYSMAMESHKINTLLERVLFISQQVRVLYPDGDYTGMTRQKMINSGLIKEKDMENPFGGTLSVGEDSYGGGGKYFGINTTRQTNLPKDACVKIVLQNWGNSNGWGTSSLLHSVGVYDGSVWHYPTAGNVAQATSACENATHIHFRFK